MQFFFQHVKWSLYRLLLWHSNRLNRFWQGFFVHLLVLVQRNLVNLHGHSRHHIRWFLVEDEVVEGLDIDLLIADDIGCDELSCASLLIEGLNGGILDAWELTDHSLHFFQFDAEATNLHLSILASNELDIAVGQIADDVACTINTGVFSGEW